MVSAPKRHSFQCSEIQSCMHTGTQLHLGMNPWLDSQEPAYDLFEKSWHLRIPGLWPLCNLRGRCHPGNALKFPLQLSSEAGALIQRQGSTFKPCFDCAMLGAFVPISLPVS